MVSSDTLTGGKCEDLEAVHDQSCLGHDAKSNKLLLGRYKTSSQELLRAIVILFISFFALHRLADVVYLLQVDCRFPKGLDYDYASDVQRQQAVSYVRNTICVSFLQHAVNFVIVLTVVLSGALLSVDSFLEKTLSCVQEMA